MPQEATGKTGVPSDTRQKPERPRDELGRPLAWGDESRLHLPDFDAMSIEENDRAARKFLGERNFFGAHEAWETAWKKAKGTGDEELFKGLSQMGAGYVHLLRGNAHGATTLLRRGASRVGAYPAGVHGIQTKALAERLEADAHAVEAGRLVPGAEAAFEPPDV
jgi:predicted metal-dependent hydrolase